jgi:hypothetical protein
MPRLRCAEATLRRMVSRVLPRADRGAAAMQAGAAGQRTARMRALAHEPAHLDGCSVNY